MGNGGWRRRRRNVRPDNPARSPRGPPLSKGDQGNPRARGRSAPLMSKSRRVNAPLAARRFARPARHNLPSARGLLFGAMFGFLSAAKEEPAATSPACRRKGRDGLALADRPQRGGYRETGAGYLWGGGTITL